MLKTVFNPQYNNLKCIQDFVKNWIIAEIVIE
jgi:hypothetical protein